jgi:hypothetical protein
MILASGRFHAKPDGRFAGEDDSSIDQVCYQDAASKYQLKPRRRAYSDKHWYRRSFCKDGSAFAMPSRH